MKRQYYAGIENVVDFRMIPRKPVTKQVADQKRASGGLAGFAAAPPRDTSWTSPVRETNGRVGSLDMEMVSAPRTTATTSWSTGTATSAPYSSSLSGRDRRHDTDKKRAAEDVVDDDAFSCLDSIKTPTRVAAPSTTRAGDWKVPRKEHSPRHSVVEVLPLTPTLQHLTQKHPAIRPMIPVPGSKLRTYGNGRVRPPAVQSLLHFTKSHYRASSLSRLLSTSSSTMDRESLSSFGGVKNIGNTCYLSAVVASMLHIACFRDSVVSAQLDGAIEDARTVARQSNAKTVPLEVAKCTLTADLYTLLYAGCMLRIRHSIAQRYTDNRTLNHLTAQ
jgi:hypothetical protein